jgi:hypothetical protein
MDSEKVAAITFLLNTKDNAQYLTWTQLGIEVRLDACASTIQTAIKEKGFIDRIMKRQEGISQKPAEKQVEQAEN